MCNKESSAGYKSKSQLARLLRLLIAAIPIGLSTSFTAPALGKTMPPDIRDLIGAQVVGTTQYPFGWQNLNDCSYGRSLILCSMLKNGNKQGLILQKQSYEPRKKGEKVPATITDVIELKRPNTYDNFAFYCYPLDADPKVIKGYSVFAEVRFAKRCDVTTKIIQRAWTMNLDSGKFEKVNDTKNLICEYGYSLRGEPEFRSGCPGYTPIPSQ
jgi:hypothetical protein